MVHLRVGDELLQLCWKVERILEPGRIEFLATKVTDIPVAAASPAAVARVDDIRALSQDPAARSTDTRSDHTPGARLVTSPTATQANE